MDARTTPPRRAVVAVTVAGLLIGAVMSLGFIESRNPHCCGRLIPFASIYHDPLSKLDMTLAGGDGHAFAVIAEDPLLSRPQVLRIPADFSYRAQRPVWGYLTWAVTFGQARFVGWTLVALTILSCGLACAVIARLLAERGRSVWWALVVPFAGFETLTEMTPELFALALVGIGLMLWQRDRRRAAVVVFCVAVLTREQSAIAVAALGLWCLAHPGGPVRERVRAVLPLAIPPAVYVVWISFLRLRLGNWPFYGSNERLSLPGMGLVHALQITHVAQVKLFWVAVALLLCAAAVALARHDVLTWMTVAYALFGSVMGSDVWNSEGFQRALLPLYVFGAVAVLGGLRSRPAAGTARGRSEPTPEPALAGVR